MELELTCMYCGCKWTARFTKSEGKRFIKNGWLLNVCNSQECNDKRRAEVVKIAENMTMVDALTGEATQ
jgi:hypothetical protein